MLQFTRLQKRLYPHQKWCGKLGITVGEMERDCMISHGAAQFLRERLVNTADPYPTYICDSCGFFATYNPNYKGWECPSCNKAKTSKIIIPYALKLLFQEFIAISIAPRIITANDIFSDNVTVR